MKTLDFSKLVFPVVVHVYAGNNDGLNICGDIETLMEYLDDGLEVGTVDIYSKTCEVISLEKEYIVKDVK